MPFTITKSDGSTLATIADGFVDASATGLSLPGPNYVGYGRLLNQNLVYLLENFASNSTPQGTNVQGQLWFNKSNQTLNVFTNQGYLPVAGITNAIYLTINASRPPLLGNVPKLIPPGFMIVASPV